MENNQQSNNENKSKKKFNKRHHRKYGKNKPKKQNLPNEEINDEGFEELDASALPTESELGIDTELAEDEPFFSDDMFPELSTSQNAAPSEDENEEKVEVIGIRFKKVGKVYYFAPEGIQAQKGDFAIVDTARGLEFGEVFIANKQVGISEIVPPLRPVIRIATEADIAHNAENSAREKEAFSLCLEQIAKHKLDMKLVDAQYTFDNSKLLFYFTSSGRVDFRELVKDLAALFRTRIELRQIGIRDEAKLIGGLGACGRPLCCSTFLSDFVQVSIKMAKEQGLFLNSSKISGTCGRLMCCLKYEQDTYEYETARTPSVDSTVKTPDGVGVVIESRPLTGNIKVKLNGSDEPPKIYHRDSVKLVRQHKKTDGE